MNNSKIFKMAHKMTKEAIKKGDSYQVTFAAALRLVIQAVKEGNSNSLRYGNGSKVVSGTFKKEAGCLGFYFELTGKRIYVYIRSYIGAPFNTISGWPIIGV